MTHLPSDDEARDLYLGLKRGGYDNAQRVKLSSTIKNVELPDGRIDLSQVDLPPANAITAMYADLFKLPDLVIIDVGDDEAPRKPCIAVPCPPWSDAPQAEWDEYNALVTQRMEEFEAAQALLDAEEDEDAVVDDSQG